MTESLTSRVSKATQQIEDAGKVYSEVKCADSNTMVDTGCGQVPSLRKVLKDLGGYRYKGVWATGTKYEAKDQVKDADGAIWLCIENHTSGADFDVDAQAGKWIAFQVIRDTPVFNRRVIEFGVGVAFGPYEEDGRTLLPRLRIGAVEYVAVSEIAKNFTFTSADVDDQFDGTVAVQTSGGEKVFSKIGAEAIGREEFDKGNVHTYGAIGDGIKDDTIAFKKAARSGMPVYGLSGKTYYIKEPLDLKVFLGNGCKIIAPNGFINVVNKYLPLIVTNDYREGDRELKVESTYNIEDGALCSIRSTDLYNTERKYYYKGVNSKLTVKDNTTLVLSTASPFSMSKETLQATVDESTGVYVANPIYLNHQDYSLFSGVSSSDSGIRLWGCSGKIKNVSINGYSEGFNLIRCIDFVFSNCSSFNSSTYGAVLVSCTNVTINRGHWDSQGVGFDTGGYEPLFGIVINNASLTSSGSGLGLSFHNNMWDACINSCNITGIKLAGHSKVTGGTITSRTEQGGDYFYLHVGIDSRYTNYSFEDVVFCRDSRVHLAGQSQETPINRNKIKGISFCNCSGNIALYIDLALTSELPDKCEIDFIDIISSDVSITLADVVKRLRFNNAMNSGVFRTLGQVNIDQGSYIGFLHIENTKLNTGNEDLQVYSFNNCLLSNVSLVSGTSIRIQNTIDHEKGVLAVRDCVLGVSSVFRTDKLRRMLVDNSQLTVHSSYIEKIETFIQRDKYS